MAIVLDGSNLTTNGLINSGTAQNTTSGTYVDFTGIPSGVKRVTFMFNGFSTSGTSNVFLQLGTLSGGIESTGYVSTATGFTGAGGSTISSTSGLLIGYDTASYLVSGHVVITLLGSNTWVSSGIGKLSTTASWSQSGNKTLGGTLDRVRLTTANGTDTFDAGSVNILYE